MRLPIEWIKEYAPVEAEAEEIARRLTMAGLEVEETAESALGPVLDIKVTPNRGDCLSVVGVARELAASSGVPMRPAPTPDAQSPTPNAPPLVTLEAPDLCPRYAARLVRNIRPAASPPWMQARLEAAGMRPINGIVDVSNYVMLETGQPLHAFDYDTLIERRIVVRRARPGEKMMTLDGVERDLTPEMLVIADAERPVAVAGVMGGAETEMSERTHTMLLESAHFHPLSVRATARALNLRTEASYRFERVVDPEGVVAAADRACQLIAELGLGEVEPGVTDVYPNPLPPRVLSVRPARVSLLLGFEVTSDQVADSLERLGFESESKVESRESKEGGGDGGVASRKSQVASEDTQDSALSPQPSALVFLVPSWRPDIVREVDLVEEVGRVLGYEHIPEKLPDGDTTQGGDTAYGRFAERVRDILVGAGLQEIESHTLLAPGPFEDPRTLDRRIAIRSALSAELSGLRRSVLPGLMDALERNARRGQTPLALFEVGRVFHQGAAGYEETTAVGGALVGPLVPASWQRDARFASADFYTGRGLIERLADGLGIGGLAFARSDDPRLHPGRAASVLLDGRVVGFVGELHPDLTADLTLGKQRAIVFELSLEALMAAAGQGRPYRPLSPFPAVVRDLAPRLPLEVPYERVRAAVEGAGIGDIEQFGLTDVFTGAPLPEGVKSLTLSFTFRAADRTLTDAEVNAALAQLRAALERECEATFVG